ncbi:MAG: hypothetical protein Kow0031_33680 [Anaerolineae bacterium]
MTETTQTQDTFTEKLSLWLDDELSRAEVAELQQHMQQCVACRQTYAELSRVDGWLRDAARLIVVPETGFVQRVETRLAAVQPRKLWQIWLAVMGLVLGALFFVAAAALFGGLTLYSAGTSMLMLNTQMVHQGLVTVINTADSARFFMELGLLFLRSSFITMQQPLFWGVMLVAVALGAMWVQLLRKLHQRGVISTNLLIY